MSGVEAFKAGISNGKSACSKDSFGNVPFRSDDPQNRVGGIRNSEYVVII
jgi:hypothetical protein